MFDDFNSVLGAVSEWMDVASGKNCVELVPQEELVYCRSGIVVICYRDRMCTRDGVRFPPRETKDHVINCFISEPVLIYCRMKVKMLYCQLVILREYFPGIGYRRFYLIRGYWRLQDFALMQLMRSLFCAAISVRFGTEPEVSDVTHGNTRRDPYDNVRTLVGLRIRML